MKGPIIFVAVFFGVVIITLFIAKIVSLKKHNLVSRTGIFRVIDKFLVAFSVIVIVTTLLWDINLLRYKKPILHKNWSTVLLEDFRGLKRPKTNLYGEAKFAFVSTSIKVRKYQDKISVETFFHPCRSYVYNRKLFANNLLSHEMYHFHITEYCARLIRKEIHESIAENRPIHLRRIKKRYIRLERELQYQYDDETYHSYVHGVQLDWQEKMDSLLLTLDDYSNTIITLK